MGTDNETTKARTGHGILMMKLEVRRPPLECGSHEGVLREPRVAGRRGHVRTTVRFPRIQFTAAGSGSRSSSARTSPGRLLAQPRASISLSLTLRPRARKICSVAALRSAKCSTAPRTCTPARTSPDLFGRIRVNGPVPSIAATAPFTSFGDPDGNGWLFQEI